nr:Chain C, Abnormal spindle-like microcephaly-associated protein homolog [Mus musculus]
LSPDSFLND